MPIEVTCDHNGCHTSFEAGIEGDWSVAPPNVASFALEDSDYTELLYVYFPAGWVIERAGLEQVIHCPLHAKVGPTPPSPFPPERPDDSHRYWGD